MASLALLTFEHSALADDAQSSKAYSKQSELGQYMTPQPIAEFMANQFDQKLLDHGDIRLLDAGAGQGALSEAFILRWLQQRRAGDSLYVDAYELDPEMVAALHERLDPYQNNGLVSREIYEGDFIANAVEQIRSSDRKYTHVILNPPYKKINSDSQARRLLASVGIDTVNLYSGFVALGLELLKPGGELVAIIPRSFCNGPYYKSFRKFLLSKASIESIHLFSARDKVFSGDSVLQENVVIDLRKGGQQRDVNITTSTDATFFDLVSRKIPFSQIVFPADKDQFIRIPTNPAGYNLGSMSAYQSSLADINLRVSTGPVVDFRLKRHLRYEPETGDIPLLYPGHFSGGRLEWPKKNFKKPNALQLNSETSRWLYPRGFYVVVKRFSSKEEKRRIIANLLNPNDLPNGPIGFENHLNVFHNNRGPLSEDIARGLATFLNAKVVDDWFRQFNGHTQVNATDLRSLPYPDLARLLELGQWSKSHPEATVDEIDNKVSGLR